MIQNNLSIQGNFIKDNVKGQKIAAALYLVTAHLSDNDPLKHTLRTHAVALLGSANTQESVVPARHITDLLGVAVIARLISEKNASIITLELRHFLALADSSYDMVTAALEAQFGQPSQSLPTVRPSLSVNMSKKTAMTPAMGQNFAVDVHSSKSATQDGVKMKRQEHILSFINERKSAGIKDIALLFSDTSEKTIQRELGTLVASGRITKRGAKRWSVYMAI